MRRKMMYIVVISMMLSVFGLPGRGQAEWSEKLRLPSEITPTPTPQPGALAFPTTADEIAKSLTLPSPSAGTKGLAGIIEDTNASQTPLKIGALILFDSNSDVIQETSKPLLREYGKALQGPLKEAIIIIGGHTDSRGAEEYNLLLSNRRAEAVRKFLTTEFQLDATRLIAKPFGESEPIDSNETEDGQARNRRVEFIRIR